ncbi:MULTISPECIES: helix-turn-helix domain-containing protein [Chryseobacterium]|uniref:helix-turn-helix domain-containing protein n=1 Tax=Chryseobacterium TaxID=59732 RepID=UPI001C10F6F3|nr:MULTISPECIES: AraC family transcriptional regulator [Chryseobacterium]MDH5033734.1 AraC family transcriptional regulator [Chryseobacterium cucumeris]QWT87310.1 helix-turn-helix transcriptional regulator [Chryseobacterium sp. PCH239]
MSENNIPFPINYSCHFSEFREGEQFARIHSLGLVLSGEMELNDGITKTIFKEGELYSARKNSLLKFAKYPPKNGEIRTISIYFDDAMLHDFSREYGYQAEKKDNVQAYIKPEQKALHSFMYSLLPYEDLPASEEILKLKQKEALLLLLNYDPGLKDILFDFSEPYKIDIESFMNKNFHFNVNVERFAYLTGRSLSAFKRDFQKIFGIPPRQWLQLRRLKEAHFLLTQKGRSVSDIYLDLGFENLSHFSFAFKKQFGYPPSALQAK